MGLVSENFIVVVAVVDDDDSDVVVGVVGASSEGRIVSFRCFVVCSK